MSDLLVCSSCRNGPLPNTAGMFCAYCGHEFGRPRLECRCPQCAGLSVAELVAELERLHEAARVMADPEHCLHAQREYLPWQKLADQSAAALAKFRAQRGGA